MFEKKIVNLTGKQGESVPFTFAYNGSGKLLNASGTCGCTDVRVVQGTILWPTAVKGNIQVGPTWSVGKTYTKTITAVVRDPQTLLNETHSLDVKVTVVK